MNKFWDKVWKFVLILLAGIGIISLALVLFFIIKEALPLFSEVSLEEFLFGTRWMPIDFGGSEPGFGIFPFILSTLYVALLGVFISLFWSLGIAVFLALEVDEAMRSVLYSLIETLAAIPSVIYGFLGMVVLLPVMKRITFGSGHSVLAASLVLSLMLIPYLTSTISDSLVKLKIRHFSSALALGIDPWHVVRTMLLPAAKKNILFALILAIGRAMGETMAVLMLIGNAKVMPQLLGKGETIAALIALEMGSAEVGSLHYHALYAAGLVLLLCLIIINSIIMLLRRNSQDRTIV